MLTHLPDNPHKRRSPVLIVLSVCLIAVLACSLGGGAAATDTPAPAPTQAPATEVAPATEAAPADTPLPPADGGSTPVVITAAGDIAAAVEDYRSQLGADNGGAPGSQPGGRREINWDGVPDELSAPNDFPADFFNAPDAPRARGIIFSTPGNALQVSADSDNPTGTPPRFGNINPSYADIFKAFSEERLFSPLGSNVVELTFFVPGTQNPALVRGYGAVYTDADTDHTAFEYFAQDGSSLGRYSVPVADAGLSFLGVVFDQPVVARVRVEYGTVALGPDDDAANDVAVMDDFIYAEPQAITAGAEPTVENTAAGEPGFSALVGPANRDAAQGAQNPALALGTGLDEVWMAWTETTAGDARQIFVSLYDGTALQARGDSLNLRADVAADQPSITLAGEDRAVPWVAWSEPSPGFNDVRQIFASRFLADTGLWQPAGQDRGGGEPSLNHDTNREATGPVIFAGSTEPGQPPTPWVVWEELSGASNFVQIFVARGVQDDTALGGFRWDPVGENRFNDEPTLNVDDRRDAQHPSAVFAETDNAVPWITWHELGADRPGRVFTARGVADANAPGGFKWVSVPPCPPDETACALNVNPLNDAAEAAMAAGSLVAGDSTVPWIVWPEVGPTGKYQIHVSRLDPSTGNSFLNVGGSLNVDENHNARDPVIAFVGSVPYVAWLEEDGTGRFVVQVRHLASDPETGTWVLDTPESGFGQEPGQAQTGLFALGGPDLLFLAWANGDPAAAQLILGQFRP